MDNEIWERLEAIEKQLHNISVQLTRLEHWYAMTQNNDRRLALLEQKK